MREMRDATRDETREARARKNQPYINGVLANLPPQRREIGVRKRRRHPATQPPIPSLAWASVSRGQRGRMGWRERGRDERRDEGRGEPA